MRRYDMSQFGHLLPRDNPWKPREQPWKTLGMSRRTWYRRRAEAAHAWNEHLKGNDGPTMLLFDKWLAGESK